MPPIRIADGCVILPWDLRGGWHLIFFILFLLSIFCGFTSKLIYCLGCFSECLVVQRLGLKD